MQKSILKPVFTITIIFIIVGVFVFLTKIKILKTQEIKDVNSVDYSISNHSISFEDTDAITLYPGLTWNFENQFIYAEFGLEGSIVVSEPTGDKSMTIKQEFRKYFEDILFPLGYKFTEDIMSDGAGESLWAYQRDNYYVVLSYVGKELVPKEGPFDCPCSWVFTVFTGHKVNYEKNLEKNNADSTKFQPAYLINAYSKDGKNYIDVDYVEWLGGDASIKAQVEDGKCPNTTDCYAFPNGYKRNKNPQIRTFEVSPNASIEVNGIIRQELNLTSENPNISFESFANRVSTVKSYYDYNKEGGFKQPKTFINIEIENNSVTKIVEPYQE